MRQETFLGLGRGSSDRRRKLGSGLGGEGEKEGVEGEDGCVGEIEASASAKMTLLDTARATVPPWSVW
jgi:hypothetical protein